MNDRGDEYWKILYGIFRKEYLIAVAMALVAGSLLFYLTGKIWTSFVSLLVIGTIGNVIMIRKLTRNAKKISIVLFFLISVGFGHPVPASASPAPSPATLCPQGTDCSAWELAQVTVACTSCVVTFVACPVLAHAALSTPLSKEKAVLLIGAIADCAGAVASCFWCADSARECGQEERAREAEEQAEETERTIEELQETLDSLLQFLDQQESGDSSGSGDGGGSEGPTIVSKTPHSEPGVWVIVYIPSVSIGEVTVVCDYELSLIHI